LICQNTARQTEALRGKILLHVELEKGEYNAKAQALSDAPELKIVMFIKISRYYNRK